MLKLKKFKSVAINKAVNKVPSKRRTKYCDSSIVPEIGHKHQLRMSAVNDYLKDTYFTIIGMDQYANVILALDNHKPIVLYTKRGDNTFANTVYKLTRPKGDLVYNEDNTYNKVCVNGRIYKSIRKVKQVKPLEEHCVIKLINCDNELKDHAFLVNNLKEKDSHYTCNVCNGKKLHNEINSIEYLDEIEGGYDFVVVASQREVYTNTHSLYGYCKDAFKEFLYPTKEYSNNIKIGNLIFKDDKYKVRSESNQIFDIDIKQEYEIPRDTSVVGVRIHFIINHNNQVTLIEI